ncbi:aspartyl/glutamyl-tRNA(Asn/Gln) amidotransferase, B subunit [Aedoeadaptatus nemausensis]|uniref:Aspartyl/glutamyl-tRNA(Asn/Gln) amidotransferase subunit B n=1 Tax=Aedoeadaptatus nemausensis TaxID=2582829 RepID=A0A6V6XZA3_9FIRM|nr:Asp-tRNA(Asn)/Glu-tRNA(Gln) amidotransferase subunit GatB [Peptoniphilus nemausensis]CAC9924477.1 aspartyl/glutamyl-tRNA(Asn/Gln) amidotransferase, B subunit [Peptoniphilus nemausensis]
MSYKTIVGLEIHVELSTKTKAFCGCENAYGREPNTCTCPVCLGMPGATPVLNKGAVERAIEIATAFHMTINHKSTFYRKNYFYPDLTKGYQITQTDEAVANHGYIEIEGDEGEAKKIGIHQIQIEEDTGKSLHTDEGTTLMDYNRCGVPLIEIVSDPDMSSGREARIFLEKLRNTLRYLGVSDVKMEEGSLRCDVNVNIKNTETGERSAISEVKNLNSFRAVEKAIDYEVDRQIAMMEKGESEPRATRRWDDSVNETIVMRTKYTESDYRFAPEGDLGPLFIDDEWIAEVRSKMAELPDAKLKRFIETYRLKEYDAKVICATQIVADFYEKVAEHFKDYDMLSNWFMTEFLRRIEVTDDGEMNVPFEAEDFAYLLEQIKSSKINNNAGKKVFRKMCEEDKKPKDIIEEEGLVQIGDASEIEAFVKEVLDENPESVEQFRNGKDRVVGFLVGQVMKKSRGKANPQMANELLVKYLKG